MKLPNYCLDARVWSGDLTLFAPAYLTIPKNWEGGGAEYLNMLGLGGVRVPILFGNDLLWYCLPSKRIYEVWMHRILQNNVWVLKSLLVGRRLTQFVKVAQNEILVFLTNLFYKLIIGKSQVLQCTPTCICIVERGQNLFKLDYGTLVGGQPKNDVQLVKSWQIHLPPFSERCFPRLLIYWHVWFCKYCKYYTLHIAALELMVACC